ncbi:carboxymethylenebutenolidase-like protein [Chlorella sorokiniana]|jgi:carboxymethylenebutenolidase|uniref:Carboxymethylenebutenolidase-like protein n=1 Tax=Chlorella sorokiniana TaxID=3076 RepID=A0A2P6TQ31_CHLSO|nr:carboxymethylenebutenolidase-like protein [Chlorella sorokiniana]|eukprot:PRW56138.1 carboxymethylenebutenolidase-like protein [Chlorella sorokiniana]
MATIKGGTVPGEMQAVTFGNNLPGYVCGEKGAPAVVVLQEWWGVVPTIVDHALRLSQEGYRCLVPDLYKGKIGVDKEEASHLLSKLDWVAAVEEIKQAVEFLRSEGAPKVGAMGFCMGGALTLCAAQHAGVDAANPFYGLPGPEICQPENIKVPVYLHHGALDAMKGFSDPESAQQFADKVNAAGGSATLFVYEGSGHGFLNVGEEALAKRAHMGFPEPPANVQELAWSRVLELFARTLKA